MDAAADDGMQLWTALIPRFSASRRHGLGGKKWTAPEALTQQQQTWNSRFFSDLVDSLYNGETDDAATAALAAMDAAADDGMQLWTALKREIDITLPSARSHAEDQLKTKTKQKHDETVAEFGLRFRGAVREFKNRGGEMTNYKYAELFAANVHERHQRIALELVTDLDPDDDNAIIIPDIIQNPDNAPEALTQQRADVELTIFLDLVDSLYNGETDDAATAALAAMDAAADDGMQLWTALKREIDITLPSARSHAEDQLKTKTKQKHDETVAEFGLRFRDPTTTTRSSYPTSSVAPTNARPYTIVSYAQIQKTADAALHYPCKGAAVAVTAAAWAAEEAATPNVLTRSDTNDAAKTQTVQLHTLTTLRCVMRLAARVTTQHVGAATPTQAAEVAVDEADIKVAEADEEDDTRCTTDASYHGIGGTQQYLPPPPPLPSQLMQNNIARVGEAFPTMNAPPPTGQMYQTGPYRRTFAITLATNEPNCSKYIVDNASPYTLTDP
ncbi:hypothetical protein RI054_33g130240 [Pseudoscourfieldia marina]